MTLSRNRLCAHTSSSQAAKSQRGEEARCVQHMTLSRNRLCAHTSSSQAASYPVHRAAQMRSPIHSYMHCTLLPCPWSAWLSVRNGPGRRGKRHPARRRSIANRHGSLWPHAAATLSGSLRATLLHGNSARALKRLFKAFQMPVAAPRAELRPPAVQRVCIITLAFGE
jgi:hypothetical protein